MVVQVRTGAPGTLLGAKGADLTSTETSHPRRPPVSPRRRAPHPDQSQPAPPAHGAVARGLSAYPPSRTSRRAPANGFGRHGCTGAYLIDVEAPSPTAPSRDTACMRPEQLFSTTYGCCGCEGMRRPRHRPHDRNRISGINAHIDFHSQNFPWRSGFQVNLAVNFNNELIAVGINSYSLHRMYGRSNVNRMSTWMGLINDIEWVIEGLFSSTKDTRSCGRT